MLLTALQGCFPTNSSDGRIHSLGLCGRGFEPLFVDILFFTTTMYISVEYAEHKGSKYINRIMLDNWFDLCNIIEWTFAINEKEMVFSFYQPWGNKWLFRWVLDKEWKHQTTHNISKDEEGVHKYKTFQYEINNFKLEWF